MRQQIRSVCFAAAAACVMVFGLAACDDDSGLTGSEFYISPSDTTLDIDDTSIVLQSVGGIAPMHWSVSDDSLGTITSNGYSVVYTRTSAAGVNLVKAVDSRTWEATATIRQLSTSAASDLKIAPTSFTLSANNNQTVFTASGGVEPYKWSVGVSSRGHVVAQKDDSQVVYVRDTAGDNTAIVTDHAGAVAIATVSQPSGAALTISASPATLNNNGDQSILTVSGGAPTYTWSLTTGSRGTLSATTGATVIYTRSTSGNQVVTVTDGNGSATSVTITQPSTSSLRATASPASLSSDGAKSILTATGGNPPYTWSIGDDSLGGLSANTGTTVTYTRNSSGDNVMTVTDRDGSRYSFIISQP